MQVYNFSLSQLLFTPFYFIKYNSLYFGVTDIIFYSAALVGALNDRLLLANPTDINPRQKKGVEIKSCLIGLLEPLLIGFATMQQNFEQKLDLSEILYQITSRFCSPFCIFFIFLCLMLLIWLKSSSCLMCKNVAFYQLLSLH